MPRGKKVGCRGGFWGWGKAGRQESSEMVMARGMVTKVYMFENAYTGLPQSIP